MQMESGDLALDQVKQEDVERYSKWLIGRGSPFRHVTRANASLKSFYNYMLQCGYMNFNPAKKRIPEEDLRGVASDLIQQGSGVVFGAAECTDFKGYRDRAMLELLNATGIRVSELIELNVTDLNLNAGCSNAPAKINPA
jgi:integrase/recombinase XerD